MAHDDWRLRVELGEQAEGFLERLTWGLSSRAAVLADELKDHRLAATHEGDLIYVYADSALQAQEARRVVEVELADDHLENVSIRLEHWLPDEDRWDDEPAQPSIEEETVAKGYSPWEVRVECDSREEAEQLSAELQAEGRPVVRRWRYLIVGADSEKEARELSRRLHGDVEAGGELVWETTNSGPFAIFRHLGSWA